MPKPALRRKVRKPNTPSGIETGIPQVQEDTPVNKEVNAEGVKEAIGTTLKKATGDIIFINLPGVTLIIKP